MNNPLAGAVEIGLAFAIALGLATWQLVAVKRSIRRDKAEAAERGKQGPP